MAFCGQCGAEVERAAGFCGSCGASLSAATTGEKGAGPADDVGAAERDDPNATRQVRVSAHLDRGGAFSRGPSAPASLPGRAATSPPSPDDEDDIPAASIPPGRLSTLAVGLFAGVLLGGVMVLHHVRGVGTTRAVEAPDAGAFLVEDAIPDVRPARARPRRGAPRGGPPAVKSAPADNAAPSTGSAVQPAPTSAAATSPTVEPSTTRPASPTAPLAPPAADSPPLEAPPPPRATLPASEGERTPSTPEEMLSDERAAAYAEGIRYVVATRRPQVRSCYERAFKAEDESPGGRVVIAFGLTLDGHAADVTVESNSTGSAMLGECLRQRLAEWRFPRPPEAGYLASYPFVFGRRAPP